MIRYFFKHRAETPGWDGDLALMLRSTVPFGRGSQGLLVRQASLWILVLGAAVGTACFSYYYCLGLTVAHYDAKAHLVVARRIVDSIVPGYAQMGANWLPLLHLLYLPFVLLESQYRSGFLPSLISVASFALSGWLVFRIARRVTASTAAGVFASALLLANSNLEYLQSCPLTEPIYMLLQLLSLHALMQWREANRPGIPWMSAIWAALGGLCRYEGWYFLGGVVLLLAWDFGSSHLMRQRIMRACAVYIGVFTLPLMAHFGFIYARLGDSFLHRIVHGNPAPYETYKRPFLSLLYHAGELCQACAVIPLLLGLAGIAVFFLQRGQFRSRAPILLLWLPSLINISALYWGMIYRVRYSVLLVPAVAIFASLLLSSEKWTRGAMILASFAAMTLPWLSWYFPNEWRYHYFYQGPGTFILPALALVLFLLAVAKNWLQWPLLVLCLLGMQVPVLKGEVRPIIDETLEHGFIEPERQEVLRYLLRNYDGSRILIDMGKLAPLVYDSGLPVKEFLYSEGDDALWRKALQTPESEVGWLCAEKGDEVWERLQVDPNWVDGYSLAVQTDYFRVYQLKSNVRGNQIPARRFE